jgi:hypothetical protein
MRKRLVTPLLSVLVLMGCATPAMTRPGAAKGDLARDTYECERDSRLTMPPTPGAGVGVALIQRKTRQDFYVRCMQARGYALAEAEAAPQPAGTPRATDAARELIHLSIGRGGINLYVEQFAAALLIAALLDFTTQAGHIPTPAQWTTLSALTKRLALELFPAAQWDDALAGIYLKRLTDAEIQEMLGFYRTPAGRTAAGLASAIEPDLAPLVTQLGAQVADNPRLDQELRRVFPDIWRE